MSSRGLEKGYVGSTSGDWKVPKKGYREKERMVFDATEGTNMNRMQKHIRRLALLNGGETYKVSPVYNKTLNEKSGLTASSFLSRRIPIGYQPRKSTRAKVAAKGVK